MTVRHLIVVVAVGMLGLVLAVGAVPVLIELTACSGAEQRVLAEFPHYGGVRLRPSGNAEAGSCMVTYRAATSDERVLAFYRQALRARGWRLQPPRATAPGSELRAGELTARRGDDTYTVLYESGPALRSGTHVAVHVARS